jgi:hypothetical protein
VWEHLLQCIVWHGPSSPVVCMFTWIDDVIISVLSCISLVVYLSSIVDSVGARTGHIVLSPPSGQAESSTLFETYTRGYKCVQ